MHQANHDDHNKNCNNNTTAAKKQNYNNNHNNNNIDMSNCLSALRSTIYLCLTLLCLYICTFSSNSVVKKFLERPTTTKVYNHNASLDALIIWPSLSTKRKMTYNQQRHFLERFHGTPAPIGCFPIRY